MVPSASRRPSGTRPKPGARRTGRGAGLNRFVGAVGIVEGDEAVSETGAIEETSGPTFTRMNCRRPGPGTVADAPAPARSFPAGASPVGESTGLARSMSESRPFPKTRLDTCRGSVTAHCQCKSAIFTTAARDRLRLHVPGCWTAQAPALATAKSRIICATRRTVARRLSASCLRTPRSSRNLGSCAAMSAGVRPL